MGFGMFLTGNDKYDDKYDCLKHSTMDRIRALDDKEDVFRATSRHTRSYKKYRLLTSLLRMQLKACKKQGGKNKKLSRRVKRTISKAEKQMSKRVSIVDAWYYEGRGFIDDSNVFPLAMDDDEEE